MPVTDSKTVYAYALQFNKNNMLMVRLIEKMPQIQRK